MIGLLGAPTKGVIPATSSHDLPAFPMKRAAYSNIFPPPQQALPTPSVYRYKGRHPTHHSGPLAALVCGRTGEITG